MAFGLHGKTIYAVIDVGSYSMKGVIFEKRENEGPKIIKKSVYFLPRFFGDDKAVIKLREFIFSMVKSLGAIPTKITIGLGPHFGEHTFTDWSFEEKKGIRASSKKELGAHFYRLFEEHRESGRASVALPSELLVNHYPLEELLAQGDKKVSLYERISGARTLTFRTILVYLSNEIGTQLFEIKKSLGGMPIEFVPVLAAEKESIIKGLGIRDGFFINIGGEETTLFLIKNGELAHFSIFQLGTNHFLRDIAKAFSISLHEAEDLKNQYAKDLVAQPRRERLKGLMVLEAGEWEKKFLQALDTFYHVGPIPPNVFLFGPGANISEISALLIKGNWIHEFSYAVAPEIRVLDAQSLFGGDTLGGTVRDSDEVNLASLIYYSLHYEPIF